LSRQNFDLLLRDLIQQIPQKFLSLLAGQKGVKILDNTFPSVKERKADLVVELEDGSVFHLELQTLPDKRMPFRMLEYYLLLKSKYSDKPIRQMVLFVGDGAPKMENGIKEENLSYSYELRDIKEIDCKELMESSDLEDKILAVLCKVDNFEAYLTDLTKELLKLPEKERADYIRKFFVALHYRPKLKRELEKLLEERKMPLTITEEMIKQDPFFQRGLKEGFKEGIKQAVINLHKKGLSAKEIAELLELQVEEVKELLSSQSEK